MSTPPGTISLAPDVMLNDALWRVGGMHGRVLDLNGNVLHEAVEVSANVEIDRINVPLVGTSTTGYKPGRETREGSITITKLDTAWEMNIYRWLSQSLEQRRQNRGTPEALMRPFSVILEHNDPSALGIEQWQLDGCLIWALRLGINIGDELVQREFPLTWSRETPLHAFERTGGVAATGLPAVTLVGALD
ncbi:MAG TPA: phage tail tube protein [Solirubrobacteraceae bacterium]|nr:phage tail tube protein [Solirubrobacteraceae bacterium]